MKRSHLKSKSFTVFAGLLLSIGLWGISGSAVDDYLYDLFFALRGVKQTPEEIVIVAIDEASFAEINIQWPWPRSLHAELLDRVFESGAVLVGFDLLFAEPTGEDEALGKAIEKYRNVVLVNEISIIHDPQYNYTEEKLVEPNSVLSHARGSGRVGFANMHAEPDGFIRKLQVEKSGLLPFSLEIAKLFSKKMRKQLISPSEPEIQHGRWIDFLGPPRTIKTISYYQALNPTEFLPPGYLQDKIVLVGFATGSQAMSGSATPIDHYPAPYSRHSGGYYPGVEIHAQALHGFLSGRSIWRTNPGAVQLMGLLLAVILGIVFLNLRLLPGSLLFLLLFSGLLVLLLWFFTEHLIFISPYYLLLPTVCVFLINPFLQYVRSAREKRFLQEAFSTYLAPQVVKQIVADPGKLSLGGEEKVGTLFFLDIAGFTTLSEKLSPTELLEVINRSLGGISEIILEHEGMIDKFIGDCIMAAWGIPLEQKDHAEKAVQTAVDVLSRWPEMQQAEEQRTHSKLSFRIGISSGVIIAGNIGGGKRFNYTALGNDVNLAARLESLNKQYGTAIIISESTAKAIPEKFLLRTLDKVQVVGQNTSVKIFEVCGEHATASASLKVDVSAYNSAFEKYLSRNFMEATADLTTLLASPYCAKAAGILHARATSFITAPPDVSWDGGYAMSEK